MTGFWHIRNLEERIINSWHLNTKPQILFSQFFQGIFFSLSSKKRKQTFHWSKTGLFLVLDQWKVCFLFHRVKLRRIIGRNCGKQDLWFGVMNRAWASIASCSLCSTKCFRNISQFWLFVWNAELSGYWSYLSLGPRCVPSVFAGVWACISINATFIGITRDSDDFPLNVTVFHIKKNSRNYSIK